MKVTELVYGGGNAFYLFFIFLPFTKCANIQLKLDGDESISLKRSMAMAMKKDS